MHIASIGIDLGKPTFHLVALGEHSKVLIRKKFSRTQLLAYTANLTASLIGLEPCAGAHFIGSVLREQGHKLRLIPAQFILPKIQQTVASLNFKPLAVRRRTIHLNEMEFRHSDFRVATASLKVHGLRFDRRLHRCSALLGAGLQGT